MSQHAIVCNTLNRAVTHYTRFQFDSITPTHAGSAQGLFKLEGDADTTSEEAGLPILGAFEVGKPQWGTSLKKMLDLVYFSIKGSGIGRLVVKGEGVSYSYPFTINPKGVSRAQPGRGIRENYLAFGFVKHDGLNFTIDRIEVPAGQSRNRRTK